MTGAVDTWARDLASEAKELAVSVSAKHEAHERNCLERNTNRMTWEGTTSRKIDDLRGDLWKLAFGGVVTLIGALATVTWTLLKHLGGLP